MAWIRSLDAERGNVIKENGKCFIRAQWRFCPYWRVRHPNSKLRSIIGFQCTLFDKKKIGENSLPECNRQYGKNNKPRL